MHRNEGYYNKTAEIIKQ